MKKITLTALLIILVNVIIAQKFSLGPEVGVNLIETQKTDLGTDYQLGMYFGVQVKYQFSNHFYLSSGVYLTQKKKKYTTIDTTSTPDPLGGLLGGVLGGGTGSTDASVYTTTNGLVSEMYIQIPILVHYKIKNVSFFAGPYTAFLVSANRKETFTTESTATDPSALLGGLGGGLGGLGGLLSGFGSQTPPSTSSNSTDGLTSLDFGAMAGIGYSMDKLSFNLMYSYGFLDYRDASDNQDLDSHKIIRFSISYLFPWKKEVKSSSRFE